MAEQAPINAERENNTYGEKDAQVEDSLYLEQVEQGDLVQGVVGDDQQLTAGDDATLAITGDDFKLPSDAVVLPVTQASFQNGLEAKVASSAKWMAVWCTYMIKKYGIRTFFKG